MRHAYMDHAQREPPYPLGVSTPAVPVVDVMERRKIGLDEIAVEPEQGQKPAQCNTCRRHCADHWRN